MGRVFTELELITLKMKFLLVCSVISAASAAPQLLYGGAYGYGLPAAYGYAGLGLPATYNVNVIKPVAKEVEVPIKTIEYSVKETGCKNSFGLAVPCAVRRRRSAEEEKEAAPAAVLPYLGYPYAGLGLGYGLGYAGLPAITYAAPKINEVTSESHGFHLGLMINLVLCLALLLQSINDRFVFPAGFMRQTSNLTIFAPGFQLQHSKSRGDDNPLLSIIRIRNAIKYLQPVECFHPTFGFVWYHSSHNFEQTLAWSTEVVGTFGRFGVHPLPQVIENFEFVSVEVP